MDTVIASCTTVTALTGLFIASHVWRRDRTTHRERQARLVSAWVVHEARPSAGCAPLRGVVVRNDSDAPVDQVCVRMFQRSSVNSDPGQMFAQIPPGTYYLQYDDALDEPWSTPHLVDDHSGGLTVTIDDGTSALVPATELPADLRLAFIGFQDTHDRTWWRTDGGHLTRRPPYGWNLAAMRATSRRRLAPPRRRHDDRGSDGVRFLHGS